MMLASTRLLAGVLFLCVCAIQAQAQTTEVFAGSRDFLNLPGTSVATRAPSMTMGPDGNLYLLEAAGNLVRYRVSDGTVTTMPGVSGSPPLDFVAAHSIAFNPAGVAHVLTYYGFFRIDLTTGSKTLLNELPNPGPSEFGPDGTFYWNSASDHRIRALLPSGEVRVIAGTGVAGYGGDGGPAELATLNSPEGLAIAPNGDLYFADRNNSRIRRIDMATGIITTFMGTGATTFTPDGSPAAQTNAAWLDALEFDPAGNLIVVESNRVRRIDASTTIVTTVAGNGSATFAGDGGPATAAGMWPWKLAVDAAGDIFVNDNFNFRVRRIAAATGVINTVVGNGKADYCGENVPARSACLGYVRGLDIEASGNVLIADEHGHRVRRVSAATGDIVTLMNPVSIPGDPSATQIPVGIDHDPAGNVYVTTETHRVWKLDSNGAPTFFAGTGQQGFSGDGGLAGVARLNTPFGVVFDSAGNAFIADTLNNRVRRVDAATRIITTYAGNGNNTVAAGDGGPATSATVTFPQTLAIDPQGNLLIGETGGCIRRVDRVTRVITTLFNYFGVCVSTFPPGPLNPGLLGLASAMAFDQTGNLWFMYHGNLLYIDYATNVFTFVQPNGGFRAEGRTISNPTAIEFDSLGRLYVSDKYNMRVFRISGLTTPVPDTTPPVITPTVNGPLGANGWYVGNVTVSFSVTDAESSIRVMGNCGSSSVTQDTAGITFTCTATSWGGTASRSVTIQRDTAPPVITFGTPTPSPDAQGWNSTDVSVPFTVSDALSGVQSTSKPSPLIIVGQGLGLYQDVTATDVAGNSGYFQTQTVNIDRSPPNIYHTVSGTEGNNGWYRGDVRIEWTVWDDDSLVYRSGCDTTIVSTDTAGATLTCTATSPGGSTIRSVTIRRDTTPPLLTLTTPAVGASYAVNAVVASQYACSDALSGTASCAGTVPNGSPVPTQNAGSQTFQVQATDAAGNTASLSRGYTVTAPVLTFTFERFIDPLRRSPTHNGVTAGSLVPIRWRLIDSTGAAVTNPAAFQSLTVLPLTCQSAAITLNDTATGGAGLSVNPANGYFTYNWQTDAGWTGCRRVQIRFSDNSMREVVFRFQ